MFSRLHKEVRNLPEWARIVPHRSDRIALKIEADPDGFIGEWLAALDVDQPDQYWLEVAYQCAKLQLQECLVGTVYDPRHAGKVVEFHFLNRPHWRLDRFPAGKGIHAASMGREARGHYKRVTGMAPLGS